MILDPLLITYILIGAVVVCIGLLVHLEIKIKKLKIGKNSESLEDSIVATKANLEKLNAFQKQAVSHLETVEKRLVRSVQAVETIRFNPFKGDGVGGTQSFSTAFVTENGSGVVISSLYSRDRVSIFSKPLENFESVIDLTEEEKEALTSSKKSLQ